MLNCSNNILKELRSLPASLQTLDFSYNYLLAKLPKSLYASLQTLDCLCNDLKELGSLPVYLDTLYYRDNEYMYISNQHALKFNIETTPN